MTVLNRRERARRRITRHAVVLSNPIPDDTSPIPDDTRKRTDMTDILESPTTANKFAGLPADDLYLLRRKRTADYLKAREAHEDDPTDIEAWSLRQAWADTLVEILTASGDYLTAEEARAALQVLTFPQAAERFIELWLDREDMWGGLVWAQAGEMVCAVADLVREWVADGGELGQAPMRAWTAPYLVARQ